MTAKRSKQSTRSKRHSRLFPIGIDALSQLLAALAIVVLLTAYFASSYEGEIDILISHRTLQNIGLTLGIVYLSYAVIQLAAAIVIR
jgi:hypothetical protein